MDGTAAMIDLIIDGIFVSDAASVIGGRGKEKMKDLRISRVLTISAMEIRETDRIPGIEYKFIFAMDTATQDILGNNILEGAIEYIERAVKDGANVLVHCELGVSRSVAVIIGYLMRRFEWSAKKALVYVQRTRPIASPNSSFMHQLIIFEHLGYKADTDTLTSSPLYRNFCADTGNVPITMTSYRTSSTSSKPDVVRADLESSSDSATKRYTCRKCRNALFYDIHVMRHKRGGGPLADGVNLKEEVSMDDRCEYEYLITPMKWMQLSEYQGKLNCPKCGEKLGQYIWGGRKCLGGVDRPCSAHVSPWVHIQKSKTDEASMLRPSNANNAKNLSAQSQLPEPGISADSMGKSQKEPKTIPTVVITS